MQNHKLQLIMKRFVFYTIAPFALLALASCHTEHPITKNIDFLALPDSVQHSIKAGFPNATIRNIKEIRQQDGVSYEVVLVDKESESRQEQRYQMIVTFYRHW